MRRSDARFRYILLALALMYLALGVVVGASPHGGPPAGPAVLGIFAAGIVLSILVLQRVRAWSRSGVRRFALACSAFTVWNMAVVAVSQVVGWWGPLQPGWHFTVSAAIASIPLLVLVWWLTPRR
ncbi:MAG: hypothetical protein M3Z98_07055 [Candidatus Dormibacteraeota bacterium]|nr:hypothetical protein [Candidatus Dormibacteraeota bacterium]